MRFIVLPGDGIGPEISAATVQVLELLNRKLGLAIEFETPPGKFVVSPNAPVRQIWVSAHSKSYKLDWDSVENAFVLAATGQSLTELIQEAIAKQLGEEVSL